MPDIDDLSKKRERDYHVQGVVEEIFDIRAHLQFLLNGGMTCEAVADGVWNRLPAEDREVLARDTFRTLGGGLLEIVFEMYRTIEGESTRDRHGRMIGAARRLMGDDPNFVPLLDRLGAAADRIGNDDDTGPDYIPVEPPPMRRRIQRLLAEAPAPLPGQSPALECAVTIVGFPHPIAGALSEDGDGGLKMLSPIRDETGLAGFSEHFFDYECVSMVVVRRQASVERSVIVRS